MGVLSDEPEFPIDRLLKLVKMLNLGTDLIVAIRPKTVLILVPSRKLHLLQLYFISVYKSLQKIPHILEDSLIRPLSDLCTRLSRHKDQKDVSSLVVWVDKAHRVPTVSFFGDEVDPSLLGLPERSPK